MPKINLKIYLIISVILSFLIIFFLTLVFINYKRQVGITPTTAPIPTLELYPTAYISPDIVHPTDFTGVLEEELPPEIKNASDQIQELSNQVPIAHPSFAIDFSWEEYKFIVALNEPKDQAMVDFENWISQNYPDIPTEEFIIE